MVMAPEHPMVEELVKGTEYEADVKAFQMKLQHMSEVERTATDVEKEGLFTGRYAVNPLNGRKTPIYVANYVMMDYGTGAIMAVPAHDERDFEFATKYGIDIIPVIKPEDDSIDVENLKEAYTGPGVMINSGDFDGMEYQAGQAKIIEWMDEKGLGKKTVNFRLRDWLISRQRYWGTPIPIIECPDCGYVPVPDSELPVVLPTDVSLRVKVSLHLRQVNLLNTLSVLSVAKKASAKWIQWIPLLTLHGTSYAIQMQTTQKNIRQRQSGILDGC